MRVLSRTAHNGPAPLKLCAATPQVERPFINRAALKFLGQMTERHTSSPSTGWFPVCQIHRRECGLI